MRPEDFTQHPDVQQMIRQAANSCKKKKFSDIVDGDKHQYVDLVMEGGGVLGIALVGYTYVMEEMGIRFLRIGGTSAGSINALLVAACGTPGERKSEEILKVLADLNLGRFIDGDPDARSFVDALMNKAGKFVLILRSLFIIDELQDHLGLNPGITFYDWLAGVLKNEGISTTAELIRKMNTLPEGLRLRGGKRLSKKEAETYLAIVAADVSTETKVDFPRMAPLYWNDPDRTNPAIYVRASMSIPFFFEPLRVRNLFGGDVAREQWNQLAAYTGDLPKNYIFVDGGIMSNFPIDLFHKASPKPAAPTFGVRLGSRHRRVNEIEKPTSLAGAVFDSARHCLDYDFIARHPDYSKLVAYVDIGKHYWLNFRLTNEAKVDLFVRGARAATEFLMSFDWPQYKKIRKQLAGTYAVAGPQSPARR